MTRQLTYCCETKCDGGLHQGLPPFLLHRSMPILVTARGEGFINYVGIVHSNMLPELAPNSSTAVPKRNANVTTFTT